MPHSEDAECGPEAIRGDDDDGHSEDLRDTPFLRSEPRPQSNLRRNLQSNLQILLVRHVHQDASGFVRPKQLQEAHGSAASSGEQGTSLGESAGFQVRAKYLDLVEEQEMGAAPDWEILQAIRVCRQNRRGQQTLGSAFHREIKSSKITVILA